MAAFSDIHRDDGFTCQPVWVKLAVVEYSLSVSFIYQ